MPAATIHSIKKAYIMPEEDFKWITAHLNEALPLLSVNYDREGNLFSLAVYKGDDDVVSLFPGENCIDYTLHINDEIVEVARRCPSCGKVVTVKVPKQGYKAWSEGRAHIQDVMPQVSADDREVLMSGLCTDCWDKLMEEE